MATTPKKSTVLKKKPAAPAKKAPAKKVAKVASAAPKPKTEKAEERYLYAVGRRKTAVAQVRLYPLSAEGETPLIVNERDASKYFGRQALVANALSALQVTGLVTKFRVSLLVRGGGLNGQSDAAKLAIARALVKHDALLRATLKAQGLLTRDARAVERKKPGLRKARRAPQWAKR